MMNCSQIAKGFFVTTPPYFQCPTCVTGTLMMDEESLQTHETATFRKNDTSNGQDVYALEFVYSCILKCNNKNCKEIIINSGLSGYEPDDYIDDKGRCDYEPAMYLMPTFFLPNLKFIHCPPSSPLQKCVLTAVI